MTQKHRSISLIVIHCSATRVTQDFTFEQLEACHLARGFRSIGYHYYITKDGVVYPGRPESEVGAHARHYNAHSIGICYEGGLDKNGKPADTRTPAQNQSLYSLLESLCLSCRVSGGNFTLPSLGTVLDSLPSHGSSHLTLLFINLYSLLT